MWLLMLWAVSPLALIPLLVHFYNKAGRLEKFIDRLHQQGRIDNNEYYQTTRRLPKGVAPGQMSGAVPPPVQGVGAPPPYAGAPNMPPPPQYVPQGSRYRSLCSRCLCRSLPLSLCRSLHLSLCIHSRPLCRRGQFPPHRRLCRLISPLPPRQQRA